MQKSLVLLFFTVFTAVLASQTLNEKLITTIDSPTGYIDVWGMKYDSKSGAWVYGSYDTTSKMYTLITPQGTSVSYNYVMQYNSLFDALGNSYTVASKTVSDTSYNYIILKNNTLIAEFDNINEGWTEKDGMIYFAATDAGKAYFVTYNTSSGVFTRSKPYDEVRLVNMPYSPYAEGEPIGLVGFTKDGSPYYVAVSGEEAFLVTGDSEGKHYSDIDYYGVTMDASGEPVYIAKSQGKMYTNRGNTFVVHGTKEYKTFDWIYGPVIFNNNMPVYIGQDSTGEYKTRSTVMQGNNALKTCDCSIYEMKTMPNGKLAYVVSAEKKNKAGEIAYEYYIIADGKESKKYSSVNMVDFVGTTPLFTAQDKNSKGYVVMGDEIISEKYDYILDKRYLADGRFAYVGSTYGNYEKRLPDKNYVVIDDEKFGPYEIVTTSDYTTGATVLSDKAGNYAYVSGQNTDKENYAYKYKVHTNRWTSAAYENIYEIRMAKGKVIYTAGTLIDRDNYRYSYQLYVDNKPVGSPYESLYDVKIDDSGRMTFIGSRGMSVYMVETQL